MPGMSTYLGVWRLQVAVWKQDFSLSLAMTRLRLSGYAVASKPCSCASQWHGEGGCRAKPGTPDEGIATALARLAKCPGFAFQATP